ncbi:MAG: hypothetical protein C0594_09520 [Marinilabiliales bacterium]|nr:MAG: hypothetical protein C0594_09520 [Marinilabiliales bacterium]
MSRLCVSIQNTSYDHCLELIKTSDLCELRLDSLSLEDEQLKQLCVSGEIIACFRHGKHPESERLDRLLKAIQWGVKYVDLDIETDQELFVELKNEIIGKDIKLIASFHSFTETPADSVLMRLITKMESWTPDYIKLACFVNNDKDNLRLIKLYENTRNRIILGMGKLGRYTRLISLKYAPFTYVYPDECEATADGQFSKSKMEKLQILLND